VYLRIAFVPVPGDSSLTSVVLMLPDSNDADPMNGDLCPDGDEDDRCRSIAADTPADLHLAVVPSMATEVELAANVVNAVAST